MKTNPKAINNSNRVISYLKNNTKHPNTWGKVANQLNRDNYHQDPWMMKKGNKYRYAVKAAWTKRSDFPRNKYSRDNKFKALTGLYVDAKLKRSYNSKFISMKFLAWKLGMSISELQTQLTFYRMHNGNSLNSFNQWLSTRLIHILIVSGFYVNYISAKQAILAGKILINGVTITDINITINIGDLITSSVNTVEIQQNVEGLWIHSGTIFVKTIPNLVVTTFAALNKEMFLSNTSENLLDPMTHWLNYTTSFLLRGFNS